MELPEIVDFARNLSVMIRINGPDPKGLKMRNHAFHLYQSGKTTLSASGILLPNHISTSLNLFHPQFSTNAALVVTVASIIEPFLSHNSKLNNTQGVPELIPAAQIHVMLEVKQGMEQNPEFRSTNWFGAQLLRLVDVPASSAAIQSLIEASSGSLENSWEVGWSLAAQAESPQRSMDAMQTEVCCHESDCDMCTMEEKGYVTSSTESQRNLRRQKSSDGNLMAVAATRIAFLYVPTLHDKDLPELMVSPFNKRGDILLSMGSPFGILSPLHFLNSISVGSVANSYPPMQLDESLLMADIRCLPGMEGSPVFGQLACLIGILTRPLRQTGGAEIQVVVPWKAIEGACKDLFQSVPEKVERGVQYTGNLCDERTPKLYSFNSIALSNCIQKSRVSYCSPPLPVEQAMTSVCLVTLDNGVWASGVLLNKQGLVLTNAHLLEPWRFGRTTIQTVRDETKMQNMFTLFEDPMSLRHAVDEKSKNLQSHALQPIDYLSKGHKSHQTQQFHRRISVRLDLMSSWVWCDAKVVYVSKGPLDISLLQLESVPHHLCPIMVDPACPSPGSQAFVIGHGLLGPRCDMLPSICSGVVAKVVKEKIVPKLSTLHKNPAGAVPAMLETTASVHPGGSGGAVVNSSGHLIGLVTSNAKHGGGKVIPHMNFSIPSAALEPVFMFAKDMQSISLLRQLDRPNEDLASVWVMMPPISPEPGPSVPGVDDLLSKNKEKQVKGSQFAKFINQSQELFAKSRNLNTTVHLSRDTIPSKL